MADRFDFVILGSGSTAFAAALTAQELGKTAVMTEPMMLVPRAGAIRKTQGFVKMVADAETHEVLGVSMVGESAGEVIHEAAMGLRFRARLQDFVDLPHVYPSMAEALKLVAISRFKDPRKLSCCAE